MKNIVLINGSPKPHDEDCASKFIVDTAGSHLDDAYAKTFINVRKSILNHRTDEDFETLSKADAVIIAFPLYIFCMPGILIRFLQDYHKFLIEHKREQNVNVKVYTVVNCGFPESDINLEAVNSIRSFCNHVNADFRFGVLIGGGGMLLRAGNAPFMKKVMNSLQDAFAAMAADIRVHDSTSGDSTSNDSISGDNKKIENISISMNFPRRLYFFMGDRGWNSEARKYGLNKRDLFRKPYLNV